MLRMSYFAGRDREREDYQMLPTGRSSRQCRLLHVEKRLDGREQIVMG